MRLAEIRPTGSGREPCISLGLVSRAPGRQSQRNGSTRLESIDEFVEVLDDSAVIGVFVAGDEREPVFHHVCAEAGGDSGLNPLVRGLPGPAGSVINTCWIVTSH